MLSTGETFQDINLTDEAMVQLKPAHRKSYHKKGEQRRFRPKPKHPIKVYVWGGIPTRGCVGRNIHKRGNQCRYFFWNNGHTFI